MPESDDPPATSRMFLLGIVVWYNLVIWAVERAYAAMTRVCPSAVTVTVAAASLALNAGKFVTYTAASSATVTLDDVPSHWGVHGQNPAE